MTKYLNKKGYRCNYNQKKNKYELEHREIAYKKIYLKHRDLYPLPFSMYDVHHINGDRQDNRKKNLQLLLHEEHLKIHDLLPKEQPK